MAGIYINQEVDENIVSVNFHAANISQEGTRTNMYVNNTTYMNVTKQGDDFETLVFALHKYGLPPLVVIGILGNALSFVVFTTTHLRSQSSSVYLAFLNLVDTAFLLCILMVWLSWFEINLVHRQGWCQAVVFLSYVSSFLSVWTVVSFTVERALVVYLPLRRRLFNTRSRAKGVVGGLTVSALAMYSYTLWMTGPWVLDGAVRCAPLPGHVFVVQILSSVDTLITLVLPSALIILFNILIARKVWLFVKWKQRSTPRLAYNYKSNETRCCAIAMQTHITNAAGVSRELLQMANTPRDVSRQTPDVILRQSSKPDERSPFLTSPGVPVRAPRPGVRESRRRTPRNNGIQMRTTRTLLIISSTFVLLNLPSHAFRVFATVVHLTRPDDSGRYFSRPVLFCQHLFQLLYYANFSVNFFMYCTCSRRFRMAFHLLLTRKCSRLRRLWETCNESWRSW